MAFDFNNQSSASQPNEKWKASAFLNFWLRRPDGSRVKIGAIPMHDNKEVGKALIARLQEDGAVEAMMKLMEVDFQLANKAEPVNLGF